MNLYETIKAAVTTRQAAERFGLTVDKHGMALCPFHDDETTGNFSINPNKGIYKCFSCGAGGDAIKFLMEYKDTKLSYGEALHYLAHKYSIPVDDDYDRERWQNIKPA